MALVPFQFQIHLWNWRIAKRFGTACSRDGSGNGRLRTETLEIFSKFRKKYVILAPLKPPLIHPMMRCWELGTWRYLLSCDEWRRFTRTIAASRPKMSQSTGTTASALAATMKIYPRFACDVDFIPFMPLAETLCYLCSQPKCYAFYASKVELCRFLC